LSDNGSIEVGNPSVAATPTFNPPGDTYFGAQSVTITSDFPPGATIFYTTDGSDPTTSATRFSGPSPLSGVVIPAGVTETLRAYATNRGAANSSISIATYVTLEGTTGIWNNLAGGMWSLSSNWTTHAAPNGSGFTADFSTLKLTGNTTVTLGSPTTIGTMLFGDQGETYNWLLEGSATLTLDAGTMTPVVAVSNQTTTIDVVLAGTNGLTKTGNGTLALANLNTYAGGTVVDGGTLTLMNGGSTGTIQGALTINPGATVILDYNNALGYNSAQGVGDNDQVFTINIYGSTLKVIGGNGDTGVNNILTLMGGTLSSDGNANSYFLMAEYNGYPCLVNTVGTNVTSVISSAFELRAEGFSSYTFNVAAGSATPDLLVSGPITGNGGLIKTGAGVMQMTGTNTYTGATTINGGTLTISNGGTLSTSSAITANNTGTLSLVRSDAWGNSAITTSSPITVNAGGTLVTHSFNTLWGLTLNSGTFLLQADGTVDLPSFPATQVAGTLTATGTSSINVDSSTAPNDVMNIGGQGNATLTVNVVNATDLLTINAPLQNGQNSRGGQSSSLTKTGAGTLTLNVANIYTGATTVSNGTLQLGATNDTAQLTEPLGIGTVTNHAILSFASSQTVTVSNVITGPGALTANSGTAVLTAADTYSGNTTINGGALQLVGSGSLSVTPQITVNRGGTFDVSRLDGSFTVGTGQILGGNGLILGNVVVNGRLMTGVTNTINGNLTYNPGGAADFNLTANAMGGGNDQIILNGAGSVLSCGGANVGIYLTGASLDEANDYVLFNLTGSSANVVGDFNATPVWLGATPADASSYKIVTSGGTVVLRFRSSGTTNLPAVTNLAASSVSFTSATLNGQLISTGGQFPTVTIYHGTSDGGINASAWASSVSLGLQKGSFSAAVSNLTAGVTHYFAAFASNSAGTAWATPSKSFTTLALIPATVTNLTATEVSATIATLNGQVLDTGSESPTVTIYFGATDGGSNPNAWANQTSIGVQTGAFSYQVGGLTPGATYYFTTSVSNNAGVAWGRPSQSFSTLKVTPIAVLTYHYDNARQGADTNETVLTLSNVNTNSFGKLFTYNVDGYVYADALVATNVTIPGKGVHDVLFVETAHDTVYAFDADRYVAAPYWTNSFIDPAAGITSVPEADTGAFPSVETGISATPVIDPATGTIYIEARTKEVVGVVTNYPHRLHALDISTGQEKTNYGSPILISVTNYPGTGTPGENDTDGAGHVLWNGLREHCRPGLLLANGMVYLAYASPGDTPPYYGWVFSYDAHTLAQTGVFNTAPNTGYSGIWMDGDGPLADTNGYIYLNTGNGTLNASTNAYGDSILKLNGTNGLKLVDYFAPYNAAALAGTDADVSAAGMCMLPSVNGTNLLLSGSKAGILFCA
jgi:autotransporter-associated beta strand protein